MATSFLPPVAAMPFGSFTINVRMAHGSSEKGKFPKSVPPRIVTGEGRWGMTEFGGFNSHASPRSFVLFRTQSCAGRGVGVFLGAQPPGHLQPRRRPSRY